MEQVTRERGILYSCVVRIKHDKAFKSISILQFFLLFVSPPNKLSCTPRCVVSCILFFPVKVYEMLVSVPRARIIVALAVVALACVIMLRKSGIAAAVAVFSASLATLLMITTPNNMRIRGPGQPFEWRKDF